MSKISKNFKEISKNDASEAGGKGASLGEMTQAGIPVPPGFVVLAEAFEQFIKETDLNVEIDSVLHDVNHEEMHTVEQASEKIQALILDADMPTGIATEIKNKFSELGSEFVAVRSSATAEDSVSAAWAGQLDTFLNTTENSLLENVQKCWASLFTPRAIFYRFEQGLHDHHISVAVVVQKMVNSEKSGIAFSVHPVTEDYNQLIIEAGLGLGEAIVSGQVTPDSYVVEKEPRRIIDINVSSQSRALYRADGGGNEWKELSEEGEKQVLTEEQILKLSEQILNIENHYGFPCDIEWAMEADEIYITQSRPITTLKNNSTEHQSGDEKKIRPVGFERAFYTRDYIRDFCLIIEECWTKAVRNFVSNVMKTELKYPDIGVYYMKNGIIEVWDNETVINSIEEFIFTETQKNENFFNSNYNNYCKLVDGQNKILKKGYVDSVEDLENFISNFVELATAWIIPYSVSKENRLPKHIVDKAVVFRTADTLWDDVNKVLENTLIKLYPEFKGLHNCILSEEIYNPPNRSILEARNENFVLVPDEYQQINTLHEFEKSQDKYGFIHEEAKIEENVLHGTTAYKGKVEGKARVIRKREKVSEVEEGEIIVSPMTTPDYVPAMKKAIAFVTDEGGMTCHAAVIAREMKKPCIVGTVSGTEFIETGDIIEVDADNGIVKIIEHR